MKRKNMMTAVAVAAIVMTATLSMTALAAGWEKNDNGWWYGTDADNSQWYSGGWQWIDGNGDGVAECYWFGPDGYMAVSTTTPDGYTVNANGAWVVNGVVQTQNAQSSPPQTQNTYDANGISNIAIDMVRSTRAENAVKYGETKVVYVSGEPLATYGNGFRVSYHKDTPDEMADEVSAGYKNAVADLFREAKGATTADKAAELLSRKGYDAVSNGVDAVIDIVPYQMFWIVGDDSIRLSIMNSYK